MPTTTKFCLPEDVHPHLASAVGYTGDDAKIETHIKQATALIRRFTRRSWEQGTFNDFFNTQQINIAFGLGRNIARFTLKEKPLQSITSIKFHTGGDFDNSDELDTDLYEIEENGIVIYPTQMTYQQRALRITYVAGYPINSTDAELLDVEEGIKQACAIQAANTFRRVINETSGKKQKQDQKGFANFGVTASGLVQEAVALLRTETLPLTGRHG